MKTKKYLKIASLAVVAAIFIWTFVFLYRKSQPTVKVYETIVPETADLEKTTVATGKVEPRDEVLIKPQISGIISEVYKEAGQSVKQGEVIAKVKVITELGTLNSAASVWQKSMPNKPKRTLPVSRSCLMTNSSATKNTKRGK